MELFSFSLAELDTGLAHELIACCSLKHFTTTERFPSLSSVLFKPRAAESLEPRFIYGFLFTYKGLPGWLRL